MKKLMAIILLMSFTGCASKASNISATYISPLQYQSYNCIQVGQEIGRVSRKVMEISGKQDSASTKDAVAMTVGLIVFWPALFFMIGGDKKDELARLKGEYDALESIAIAKECSTVMAELEVAKKHQEELALKKKEQEEAEREAASAGPV